MHVITFRARLRSQEEDRKSAIFNRDKIDATPESIHNELPPVEHLTFVQCIRKYKFASLMCVLAAVGALSDGYQVQMSGSIVALDGFINTFGDLQDDGTYVVDPQYLALWGCKSLL